MNPIEQLLSGEELAFLQRHKIALSEISDARGLGKVDRHRLMLSHQTVIAIGSPCIAHGHTLRTSAGHCVMCDPKKIAFARRHYALGQVYVARSASLTLTKVGMAVDADARIRHLNGERYGGGCDWRLVAKHECAEAGKIESAVHKVLSQCAAKGRYHKDGALTECYELFDCPAEVAVRTLRDILGIVCAPNGPIDRRQSTAKSTSQPLWRKGDRVKHQTRPEWGVGVLIADGSAERAEVRFADGRDRILDPSLANLSRAS